jgi:HAD superfamily hydrolase (TIGR01509 family)
MSGLMAVIFDFDGVILDSETTEFEAHRLIYEQCGVALTPDEWCDQIGIWVDGHAGRWFKRLSELSDRAPDLRTFEAEKHRLCQALVSYEPMRGIRQLVDALAEAAIPTAIASTSPARWVVAAVERAGLLDRFRTIVTADDVARRKPAPDVYLEAARRLGVEPAQSIAIEDSGPGLASARAAGMKTVAIPHWLTERHDLSAADLRVAHAGDLTIGILQGLVND